MFLSARLVISFHDRICNRVSFSGVCCQACEWPDLANIDNWLFGMLAWNIRLTLVCVSFWSKGLSASKVNDQTWIHHGLSCCRILSCFAKYFIGIHVPNSIYKSLYIVTPLRYNLKCFILPNFFCKLYKMSNFNVAWRLGAPGDDLLHICRMLFIVAWMLVSALFEPLH